MGSTPPLGRVRQRGRGEGASGKDVAGAPEMGGAARKACRRTPDRVVEGFPY